jgi:hypothetical protein
MASSQCPEVHARGRACRHARRVTTGLVLHAESAPDQLRGSRSGAGAGNDVVRGGRGERVAYRSETFCMDNDGAESDTVTSASFEPSGVGGCAA